MSDFEINLRYDLRCPDWATPRGDLYAAALDQCAWADQLGLDAVLISEHHGSEDGYLPAPTVFAAAVAARTKRIRIRLAALVLPLHDPVRAAEQLAVLDVLSGGRLEVVAAAGYVPSEFAMFGVPMDKRGARLERYVEVMRRLWRGERFDYEGRPVCLGLKPLQEHGPPVILAGGSPISAKRAARIGDGYMPVFARLWKTYAEECARLGKEPGGPPVSNAPSFLHLSDDPDRSWQAIGPHALHDMNAYGAWAEEAGLPGLYRHTDSVDDVRGTGMYQVITPEACTKMVRTGRVRGSLVFHPLMGGLSPDLANESLRLLENRVWPQLRGSGVHSSPKEEDAA